MVYAYDFLESQMKKKHMYERIFEFIVDYVRSHGTVRGACSEAARVFYPDKDPDKALKLVYEHFRYARKRFWSKRFGVFGVDFGVDNIDETIEYNMGYYVENHGGPLRESSRFVKDSRSNRRLFELKKLVYVVLQDLVKPKHVLSNYVEGVFKDPRIRQVVDKLNENIWYNGSKYIKLPRRAAALLYLVVYTIYTKHYGVGNKPERLIKRFFEVTGYGPRDLEREIRELVSVFYDWLLML